MPPANGGGVWTAAPARVRSAAMRLSISFPGIAPIASTLPVVHAAERCGLDGIWSAEHIGFRDAIVPSAVYLRETAGLEVGVCGLSLAGRHPGVIAMEIASLAELGPGRVRVQVGTGDPSLIAKLGRTIDKPLPTTETLVHALHAALAGNEVDGDFPGYSFHHFHLLSGGAPAPVDVMAVRPLMVRTAARVADGLSLSAGASAGYLVAVVQDAERELAARNRNRAGFRISAFAPCVVADDLDAARQQLLPLFAMFDPAMLELLARGAVDAGVLVSAVQAAGPPGMFEALTPAVIDAIAVVATPDGLPEVLRRYAHTGIDELALSLIAAPEDQPRLVELLARARP